MSTSEFISLGSLAVTLIVALVAVIKLRPDNARTIAETIKQYQDLAFDATDAFQRAKKEWEEESRALEMRIKNLERTVSLKDVRIQELEESVRHKDVQIADQDQKIHDLELEINQLKEKVSQLEANK